MASTNAKHIFIFDLVEKQHDLFANASKADIQKRQRGIEEMYDLCDNDEQRSLVKDMIMDFSEMNDDVYNLCLLDMVDAIINKGYPLDECLVVAVVAAGMQYAIDMLRANGIDIHCSYLMKKGISEKYDSAIVPHKLQLMTDLETKFAAIIKKTELKDHHLGYKQSEALFCRKYRNIPNNVFPLFWWKRYANNSVRDTMFDRNHSFCISSRKL